MKMKLRNKMNYRLDAVQLLHFYNYVKDIDYTSFQYGADRKTCQDIKAHFEAIVAQCNYIKRVTGDYPQSIELNYTYFCWIIENVGDGVVNKFNETIKYLNK